MVATLPLPKRTLARPLQLQTTRETIALSGHSGAEVLLVREGGISLVRKTAGSVTQDNRLLEQAEKQRHLSFSGISFPRVLKTGHDEQGRGYFEMEYVPGRTVANIISEAMPLDSRPVLEVLKRLFEMLRMTQSGPLPPTAFLEKIARIGCCDSVSLLPHKRKIEITARCLAACDWTGIPQSQCHGDLTLENIMVSSARGVIFIDCDSCFVSSWWLDAAKLFQDIWGHWCLRKLYLAAGNGAALINASQLLVGLAGPLLADFEAKDESLFHRLPQLAALHLFRTLPYCRDEALAGFVLSRIFHVLNHKTN